MTGKPDTCAGCAHSAKRFKHSKPKRYCTRYHQLRDERCLDYRTKPSAISTALAFFKSASIK